jgi:hypothetical protein
MIMVFHRTRFPAIGEHDQPRVAHDRSALGHYGRNLVVVDVVNGCWNTTS